jgi:alkylation response protein AidB-like acyl-CoA dehydrogenase
VSPDLSYPLLVDERREIAAMAGDYLGKSAADPMAGLDLGWCGIGIDEAHGGSGGSFADLAPIIEAAGASCATTVVGWTTGVLGRLLTETGGPVAEELLPGIAEGRVTAAFPLADPLAAARAVAAGADLVVHGAPRPTLLVLPVPSCDGPRLAAVPAERAALAPLGCVDESRFLHRVSPAGTDLREQPLIGPVGAPDRLRVLVAQVAALDAVGAARKALTATLDYALERHQFGRPIGSFQAYKHRCATAFQLFKLAQSGAFRAAQDGDATLALATACEGIRGCTFVCGDAVQLHGAIGFSWESGLHAYLKRSRSAELIAAAGDELVDALLS